VVGSGRWFGTVAIAAQVRRYDRKILGQPGRDFMPAGVRLGVAVEQQKGRPISGVAHVDGGLAGIKPGMLETFNIPEAFPGLWGINLSFCGRPAAKQALLPAKSQAFAG
jgi:hypothetical protein